MSAATIAPPAPTAGHANAFSNTMTIARRNLLHIKADPEQIVGMTIQPLMFLVLFVFVFGGAIAGRASSTSSSRCRGSSFRASRSRRSPPRWD
jgi:hypothetical protein